MASEPTDVVVEPTPGEPLLSTVRNVQICATGIEYPLASGPATFTEQDLADAVASQDDPAIQAPRVWLGHPDDDRFHAGRATQLARAEPALGKIVNMRVEANGQVLVGDVVGVPSWLAGILASAYPSRSIEGFQGAETVTGHKWGLVVTDMALLGVTWPGVSTLDDLESLYSADGPEGVEITEEESAMAVTAARTLQAQVDVDDVRRAYYESLGQGQDWWWIRAIRLDPNELIVDDDEGGLYRVPFDVSGETATFDDPVEAKIQYANVSQRQQPEARTLALNIFAEGKEIPSTWASREESRQEITNDNQEVAMTPEQIREGLGLPADATDEQVSARMQELREMENGGAQPAPAEGEQPEAPAAPAAVPSGSQEAAPEPVAAGMVQVPAEVWEQVQRNAQAGAEVAASAASERRSQMIAAACREGRIAPHQRETLETMFSHDPAGAERLPTASASDGGLAPNTIPATARGADPSAVEPDAYPAEWLPETSRDSAGTATSAKEA